MNTAKRFYTERSQVSTFLLSILVLAVLSACNLKAATGQLTQTAEPISVLVTGTASPTSIVSATRQPAATATVSPTATTRMDATSQMPGCTPRADWPSYTVISGDTLGRIAERTRATVSQLTTANCLSDPNSIRVGQQLRVPVLPLTATPAPVTPTPVQVIYSDSSPSYDRCIVLLAGDRATLYRTANASDPMNARMGNWGLWISTIGDFHQMVLYPGGQAQNAFVRRVDTKLRGDSCASEEPDSITRGTIELSSFLSADAGNFRLKAGETITLTWGNPPDALMSATFYFIDKQGTRVEIDDDLNPNDGFSVSWMVPFGLSGEQISAQGEAFNAAPYRHAHPQVMPNVYSALSRDLCEILANADVPLYQDTSTESAVVGTLPAGSRRLISAQFEGGWIAVESDGIGTGPLVWIAPGASIVASTEACPTS